MRQSVNIFSKLFSASSQQALPPSHESTIQLLHEQLGDEARFFSHLPLFFQGQNRTVECMMLHPNIGVVLFSFFDHTAEELQGVTAAIAGENDNNADIEVLSLQQFIRSRLNETFETQSTPILSLLVCTRLDESTFDTLDESFHKLIPKPLTLFKGSNDYKEKIFALSLKDHTCDVNTALQTLFPELIVPETNTLMSIQQQTLMHTDLQENLHIKGLPGSGKSSLLTAKTLYEKMKRPNIDLIIFAPRTCNVHQLQAMIFQFVEHSQWDINPADITVSTFESIKKRTREKQRYDLIACDDVNKTDLQSLESLLKKEGRLISSSHYRLEKRKVYTLPESFRLSPALCAACEGLIVDKLENELVFKLGNTYMNTLVILETLLKEADAKQISILHHSTKQRRELCTQINEYFTTCAYLYDDPDKAEGIELHPLSHLNCLNTEYMIIILDEESSYDPIELISRAQKKSFILGESEDIYNIITQIKGLQNESD